MSSPWVDGHVEQIGGWSLAPVVVVLVPMLELVVVVVVVVVVALVVVVVCLPRWNNWPGHSAS